MAHIIREHLSRSVAKALTFRALILCSDGIVIFFITHRYDIALGVVFITNLASTFLYIIHERIWNGVRWGRQTRHH